VADAVALFEEYAAAYARGERPQASEYLERAGDAADELAELIDRWLLAVPVPEPDAETKAFVAAWIDGQPPLLDLRVRQGIRVDAVVEALVATLKLDPARRGKVKRYYQRLEDGLLEPKRVDRSVWAVLRDVLGAEAETAAGWTAPAAVGQAAYLRSPEPALQMATRLGGTDGDENDEIDRLFTRGVP
jgi:hypothetical protein